MFYGRIVIYNLFMKCFMEEYYSWNVYGRIVTYNFIHEMFMEE